MKILAHTLAVMALTITGFSAHAMAIFAPGDAILGGEAVDLIEFRTGTVGFDQPGNNWPGNEGPEHLIDGVGQKYLNFGKEWTGAIITPSAGPSIATSMKLWTANDAEPRDPSGLYLYGTNDSIDPNVNAFSKFTEITDPLFSLPSSRNAGGNAPLDDLNAWTFAFSNNISYTSYLVVFDLLKDSGNANSMQLAEFQLFGTLAAGLPEPGTLSLFALGLAGIGFARRRKLG